MATSGEQPSSSAPTSAQAVIMQTFATPVARITWPHADQFNGELADVLLSRLDPRNSQLAYKSETSDMTRWGDPTVDAVTTWVLRVARQFVETVSGRRLEDAFAEAAVTAGGGTAGAAGRGLVSVVVGRSWASVYHKGDHHEAHFHPNTALTAIYYVEAPGVCELDLLDPRPNIDYYDSGLTLAGEGHRVRLRCKPGDLVLFPGWLKHSVPEFQEEAVRISLSWNLNYTRH